MMRRFKGRIFARLIGDDDIRDVWGKRRTVSNATPASWYRIRNASTDAAEVYIYNDIGGWGITAEQFVSDLADIRSGAINLHINSGGGDVFDGMAIMNTLRNHPSAVNVSVDGVAASAASFIAMAGDHITMQDGSRMMIHDAHGIALGNADEMIAMASLLDAASQDIAEIYAERAGGTATEWRDRMRAETWYSAREAVEAGLADECAAPRKRKGAASARPRREAPPVEQPEVTPVSSTALASAADQLAGSGEDAVAQLDFASLLREVAAPEPDVDTLRAALDHEILNRPAPRDHVPYIPPTDDDDTPVIDFPAFRNALLEGLNR